MMHMTFYWGKKVTILFDSWRTDSWAGYLLSLIALFAVAAFYQYMEDRRVRFKIIARSKPSPTPGIGAPFLLPVAASRLGPPARFASAILFGVNSAIGYLLMLAIMSFNAGVFIAVVVGLAVGYLFFRSGGEEDLVEASTSPSNQISRRGYHIDLGAREKAVGPSSLSDSLSGGRMEKSLKHGTARFRKPDGQLYYISLHRTYMASSWPFVHDYILVLFELQLLEEDPALKRFKSYKNNLKRVSKIGDVLTILVVAACTYELYAVATVRKDQRQQH
ncbi:unnamed protein product [Musa acuminata var. zebrina]